ncbi:MAG: response regulator [Candidatus Omnitrophica bacterium]|nr:response regulator [Candidatus Omnitrophota bacterium]
MLRMLIVDDEPDICECLKDFFSARGFAVSTVFSGEEALEHVVQRPLDVVLLDIMLPGISGLEVLKRVKSLSPQTKVVMVSGLSQRELRVEAKAYGASAYVPKPFDFSEATWEPVLGHA